MSDSIGPLYTIDGGQNADTSQGGSLPSAWIDTSWLTEDVAFNITGTWSGSIALDVSNDPTPVNKTNFSTVATYSSNQSPLGIPRKIGSFIRFRRVSWVSGTAKIGISNGITYGAGGVRLTKPVSSESVKTN